MGIVTPTMPAKKTSTGKPPATKSKAAPHTNPKAAPPATKSKAAAKKSPGESKKAPNPGQVALDAKLAAEAAEKDALAQAGFLSHHSLLPHDGAAPESCSTRRELQRER